MKDKESRRKLKKIKKLKMKDEGWKMKLTEGWRMKDETK